MTNGKQDITTKRASIAATGVRAVLLLFFALFAAMLKLNAAWAAPEQQELRQTVPSRTPVTEMTLPVILRFSQSEEPFSGRREIPGAQTLLSTAHLRVEPSPRTVVVGQQFSLDVYADLPGLAVYGVACDLLYDIDYLDALSIQPDIAGFGHIFVAEVDRAGGAIRYQAGLDMGSPSVSGTVRLFTLTINAQQVTPETAVSFENVVVALSGGESILPGTTPGSVSILAPTATPTLTATPTSTATPTATHTPTPTYTTTPSRTPVITPSASPSATATRTIALTPAATATFQTSSLDPVQDTYIDEWDPDTEHGRAHTLNVRSGGIARALVQFALKAGSLEIPSGSTVSEARLRLYSSTSGRPPISIAAYGLKKPWAEYDAKWKQAEIGVLWDAPGASDLLRDRDEAEQDSVLVESVGWYEWDMTDLVQRWAQEPGTNRGILLMSESEVSALYTLASREQAGGSYAPQLLVTWRPVLPTPTPTTPPSGVIHGRVFEDHNQDQVYQPDEGVAGVVIQASHDGEAHYLQTMTTDAQGGYRFGDLAEGWYSLTVVDLPAGYRIVTELPISVQALVDAPMNDIELAGKIGTALYLPLTLLDAS